MTATLLLDATTVFIATAWVLSLIAALLPLPAAKIARAREAFRLALLPGLGAAAGLLAAFWPSVSAWLQGTADHCLTAGDHPHLCFVHAVPGMLGWHDAAALTLIAAFVGVGVWRVGTWVLAARQLHRLRPTPDPQRAQVVADALAAAGISFPGAIWIVSADQPLCFVTGIQQPVLMIAASVVDELEPDALAAVIAHEAVHVRRRDPAARLLVSLASLAHAPGLGHRAGHRWSAAAEGACDAAAAEAIGDRLAVAQALVRYQRLLNGALRQPGPAFCAEDTVEVRVRALLDPPAAGRDWRRPWPWLALGLIVWHAEALHGLFEGLLHVLHTGGGA